MKSLFLLASPVLAGCLFATNAFGFFVSFDCSNADASYRHSSFEAWNVPKEEHWWFKGEEVQLVSAREGEHTVLEHFEDPMTESTTYAVKLTTTLQGQDGQKTYDGYVLCHSAMGF